MFSNKTFSFERMCIIMKLSVHWGLQFPVATPDVPILYAGLSRLFSQRILEAVREWCFLSIRFYNCSYKEMHIISVHPLPIEIIFSQSLLHCQHSFFFQSLCELLYVGIVNLFAEASEITRTLRFSSSSSAKRRPLRATFRGSKRTEFGRCYIGTLGRMRKTSTPHCRNCLPWV